MAMTLADLQREERGMDNAKYEMNLVHRRLQLSASRI